MSDPDCRQPRNSREEAARESQAWQDQFTYKYDSNGEGHWVLHSEEHQP